MEITIRKIVPGDAAVITKLSEQLGYAISQAQTEKNINAILNHEDHDAFVAVKEQKVIGWIGVSSALQLESPSFCEIHGLVIDDAFRKKGIGNMLIEKAKEWCRQRGNNILRLRCNVKRTETHAFYLHLGFKEIKQQKIFEVEV